MKHICIIAVMLVLILVIIPVHGLYLDTYYNRSVLAMNMNGTNGSTTFIDDRGHSALAYDNAQITNGYPYSGFPHLGNGSATFDGTADRIDVGTPADFKLLHDGTPHTWVAWTKTSDWIPALRTVFATGSAQSADIGSAVYITSNRAIVWEIDRGVNGQPLLGLTTSNGIYPSDTIWHELMGKYNESGNGNATLYLDGVAVKSQAIAYTPSTANSTNALRIGGISLGDAYSWSGYIDNVYFFNDSTSIPTTAMFPMNYEMGNTIPYYYYNRGDSIAAETYNWVMQMRDMYDPTKTAYRDMYGGAKTSVWGITDFDYGPGQYPTPVIYFIMLGINDRYYNQSVTGEEIADNLMATRNLALGNGSQKSIILLEPARTDAGTFASQSSTMDHIKARLTQNNVSYIMAYDAFDLHPNDGIFDDINYTSQPDGVHPTAAAHTLIANYVWPRLQNSTASFTTNSTGGIDNVPVQFNDTSTLDPTLFSWDFGDGYTSTERNATHTFLPGNRSVKLTAENAWGANTSTQITFVNVTSSTTVPVASFTSDKTSGYAPLQVQLYDTSINYPNVWNWSVNDTAQTRTWYNYSTRTNISQTFTTAGIYNVSLSVQNTTISSPISTYAKDITVFTALSIADHNPVVVTNPYYVVYMWKRIA